MKNLQKEIVKGLKKLGISQQYNVLHYLQEQIALPVIFTNNMVAGGPYLKTQAMDQIRRALLTGPEKADF